MTVRDQKPDWMSHRAVFFCAARPAELSACGSFQHTRNPKQDQELMFLTASSAKRRRAPYARHGRGLVLLTPDERSGGQA